MRKLIAGSLAALMLMLGAPMAGSANGTAASVFGQVVDAGGRGSSGKTVELLLHGAVISSTVTGFDGRFTMNGITPGSYTLRTVVNGRTSGVQVSLAAGQSAPVVMVLPSIVTASAQAQFASLLANFAATAAGAGVATAVAELAVTVQEDADTEAIEEAISSGATLQVLVDALVNSGLTPQQTQAIVQTVVNIATSLPSNTPPEVQTALVTLISSSPTVSIPVAGGSPIVINTPPPTFTASPTT